MQNQYARLAGTAQLGESAGAQTGVTGANLASTQGNALMAAGNASAAGTLGAANAVTGGINSAIQNNLLSQAIGGGGTSGYQTPGNQGLGALY